MRQVSANAIGNPFHQSSGDPGVSTSSILPQIDPDALGPPVRRLVMIMVGAAALALALALRAPLSLTVLGLLLFGALHNVLEIRYVAGRFAALLTGRFLLLLLALTSGIAFCRLTAQFWPVGSRYAEVAHRLPDLGGRMLDRASRRAIGGRAQRARRRGVRVVLLSGVPLRAAGAPAQSGAADLPVGLGRPDP